MTNRGGTTIHWKRLARLYTLSTRMNEAFGRAVALRRFKHASLLIRRMEPIDMEIFAAFEKLEGN